MAGRADTARTDAEGKWISVLTRVLVWGLLIGTLYVLQSFFLLIFLTFVFAYIQARGVEWLDRWIPSRPIRVILVGVLFLSVLSLVGIYIVPRVQNQAEIFAAQFPSYMVKVDQQLVALRDKYPLLHEVIPEPSGKPWFTLSAGEAWSPKQSPTASLLESWLGLGQNGGGESEALKGALGAVRNIGAWLVSIISAFLLSLLFSFLIVLDLPKLAQAAKSLRSTKLQFAYDEVAPTLVSFARTLGRALEAQLAIALLNTIFTAFGVYFLLGLKESTAFLSVIVFFCSFIPVAGVFISSFPIVLLALQAFGIPSGLMAIALITVIHMIEAYILNPQLYGARLRMNPVIVLIILTIGGKLFHVWGLILGVPLCNYVFGEAIRKRN